MLKPHPMQNTNQTSDFDRLICSTLQRMGISMLNTKAKAYQIRFPDEALFFIREKSNGWFEISTEIGTLPTHTNETAVALLSLQRQQGEGPLVGIGLNPDQLLVSAYTRLRVGFCHPEDIITALQLLRTRSIEANQLLRKPPISSHQSNPTLNLQPPAPPLRPAHSSAYSTGTPP